MRAFLTLLVFLSAFGLQAQTVVQGRVSDAATGEALAFVHVLAAGEREGTTTDIDGRFRLVVRSLPVDLQFSYVGYAAATVTVTDQEPLKVPLQRTAVQLREAEVLVGENPAHRIIARVWAGRKANDGMRYRSHRYRSYSKTIFTAELDSARYSDPATLDTNDREVAEFFEKQHLLLIESATSKRFIPPSAEQEEVLAMRVSGLKDPSLLALAASTKTFSIYAPQIVLSEKTYVGPIGPASTKHYLFLLEDTLYQGSDSVFVISYRPRTGTKFEGLKGLLYVSTDGYAVQNAIAEPMEQEGGFGMKLQQLHARVNGTGPWFPHQLNTFLFLDFVGADGAGFVGIGRTYLKDIAVDVEIPRREVRGPELVMERLSTRREEAFWDSLRVDTLDLRERTTYQVIDSIGEAEKLDAKVKWLGALGNGRLPLGPVDLLLDRLVWYDGYQGFRLGAGLATNDKVSRYFRVGGYGAYGFNDAAWKYGGFLELTPWPARDLALKGYYENDVAESGGVAFPGLSRSLGPESYRWFYVDRMDRIERWGAELAFRTGGSLKWWLGAERALRINDIGYRYAEPVEEGVVRYRNDFLTGGLTGGVRFAFRERLARLPDREVSLGTRWPVLYVQGMVARKGFLDGELDLWRVNVMLEKTFHIRLVGDLSVRAVGGAAQDDAPYPFLFNLRGTNASGLPLATANAFETMDPNAFLADRYAALHVRHSFGTLLVKGKRFRPRPGLAFNAGIGGLARPELHDGFTFSAFDRGYYEAGVLVDDLLKLGFTGLGVGAFHRFGPYATGDLDQDLAVKLALSLSF